MKMTTPPVLAASIAAALTFTSCTPYQQQGAGVGALGGAAIGAIAGDGSGDVVRGAAIGAAAGAGGAALKEELDRRNGNTYRQPAPQAPATPTPPAASSYPAATRTANPNHVISPYPPHNVVDITGFEPGELARDKTTGKIFEVPAR